MATKTRQIRGEKYNVEQLVDNAFETIERRDWNKFGVIRGLERCGIPTPTEAQTIEYAFLDILVRVTGAHFTGQFGRGLIDMSSRERAIETVNSYLNRRVKGQRSAFTQQYGRR